MIFPALDPAIFYSSLLHSRTCPPLPCCATIHVKYDFPFTSTWAG